MGDLEWLGDALGDVNYWAVLVAALSSMVVGSIWYAPQVFGNQWMKAVGLSKKDMENREGMAAMFLGTFVFSLFGAAFLAAIMLGTGTEGFWNGLILGAVLALVFTAMPKASGNMFARKDTNLTAITGGGDIVTLAIMGAIVGVWM